LNTKKRRKEGMGDEADRLAQAIADLHSKNLDMRRAAIDVLAELRAVPELIDAMQTNEHWFVRMAAAQALGRMGDASAIPFLVEALHNTRDKWFAFDAAVALAQIGTPEALAMLHAFREQLQRNAEGDSRL
jgi:HEAT repeat protein